MAKALTLAITMAVAISTVGCGTFSDAFCGPRYVNEAPPPYHGVQFDLSALKECGNRVVSPEAANDGAWPSTRGGALAAFLFFSADMPLSALADTLLLPQILFDSQKRRSPGLVEPPIQ